MKKSDFEKGKRNAIFSAILVQAIVGTLPLFLWPTAFIKVGGGFLYFVYLAGLFAEFVAMNFLDAIETILRLEDKKR